MRELVALTRGYRVPQEVLDLANRLLPSLAVDVDAGRRRSGTPPNSLRLRQTSSVPAAVTKTVRERLEQEGSIGVIATAADLAVVARALSRRRYRNPVGWSRAWTAASSWSPSGCARGWSSTTS